MILLAIETSGLAGTIAITVDGKISARALATEGRRHAQSLTLEIDILLRELGIAPRELSAVAVSLGPGSFTGLRVGVVCAKSLSYAIDCPVIGVETFQALVAAAPREACLAESGNVHVVSDAQRGDFFHTEFSAGEAGSWRREGEIHIVPGDEWVAGLTECDMVLGPGVARIRDESTRARLHREPWSLQPSAVAVAQLASDRLNRGLVDDRWRLSPIYLRPSAAEEQRDRLERTGRQT